MRIVSPKNKIRNITNCVRLGGAVEWLHNVSKCYVPRHIPSKNWPKYPRGYADVSKSAIKNATIPFNITRKEPKMSLTMKFPKLFIHLKSLCKKHDAFYV